MKKIETKFVLRFDKGCFLLSKVDLDENVLASERLPMPTQYNVYKDDDGEYYINDGEDDDGVLCTSLLDDLEVDRQKNQTPGRSR